jgi:hypothetical protein
MRQSPVQATSQISERAARGCRTTWHDIGSSQRSRHAGPSYITFEFDGRVLTMEREKLLRLIAPWREGHCRATWKPVVTNSDGTAHSSKFSGVPTLADGEEWPRCVGCKKPLQLFLQLNFADLPEELDGRFGDGLLQLFYCVNLDCDAAAQGWEPFAEPTVVRIVRPAEQERNDVTAPPNHFPARTILGWETGADYPSPEEHQELGLSYDYDFKAQRVTVSWPERNLKLENLDFDTAALIASPQGGDKLSGWPYWVQTPEYPNCPQCGQRMEFVFQIDSENNLPYMFGDVGCGHITQCPTHKNVVAFGWACS